MRTVKVWLLTIIFIQVLMKAITKIAQQKIISHCNITTANKICKNQTGNKASTHSVGNKTFKCKLGSL